MELLTALPTDAGVEADPTAVEVPVVEDSAAFGDWWVSPEGEAADVLMDAGERLWLLGERACPEVLAELESVGSPEEVLVAVLGAPDEEAADLLSSVHRVTVAATSVVCAAYVEPVPADEASSARSPGASPPAGAGEPVSADAALAELVWQWTVADRFLAQTVEGYR